jgi:hypothetical protein
MYRQKGNKAEKQSPMSELHCEYHGGYVGRWIRVSRQHLIKLMNGHRRLGDAWDPMLFVGVGRDLRQTKVTVHHTERANPITEIANNLSHYGHVTGHVR